jgi:hypothetical protein
MNPCPECGRSTEAHAPDCAAANGFVRKPDPPAEVKGWTVEKTPSDLVEWARQTFDEEEFLEGVREIEQTGGVNFEGFIGDIEERVKLRD